MKRYYFTATTLNDEDCECGMNDHLGNIRGARAKAQRYANKNDVVVIINSHSPDEIIDWVYPDTYTASEETQVVETTEVCPNCEEEITLTHDMSKGFKTTCPECGNRLMLCDLCQHRDCVTDENGYIVSQGDCDYNSRTDSCRFNPPENKRTFYKVTSEFFDNGRTNAFISTVEADKIPENECHSTRRADVYVDYFDTLDEAEQFKRDTFAA